MGIRDAGLGMDFGYKIINPTTVTKTDRADSRN